MSKSEGNFFTVREIGEQYDLQALRFFMLSAHYRSPLNFSRELMEAAKNGLERICTCAQNLKYLSENNQIQERTEQEKEDLAGAQSFVEKFNASMDDDFNTADALSAVFELVKFANSTTRESSSQAYAKELLDILLTLTDVCGLIVLKEEGMLDQDIEAKIEERQAARKAKDFARADAIRKQLLDQGIILEDTREGVKWRRA